MHKHLLSNTTYGVDEARKLLKQNHFIECWQSHDFSSLPVCNIPKEKYPECRNADRGAHTETERDLAAYYFLVTFGRPPGDLFFAEKYLQYMSAYNGKPRR